MKKILIFLSLIIAAAITSCSNKEEELKAIVKSLNSDCPQDFGSVKINGFRYEGRKHEVLMTIIVSQEHTIKMESLDQVNDIMKSNLLGSLAGNYGNRRLARAIADADAKFSILLRQNGNEYKVTLSNSELRDLGNGKVKAISPQEYITNCMLTTRAQCPKMVDEITTLSNIDYKDDFVIYYYDIDESDFEVDDLDGDETKELILESFRYSDKVTRTLIGKCKEARCGMQFIYHGTATGQELKVTIQTDEL